MNANRTRASTSNAFRRAFALPGPAPVIAIVLVLGWELFVRALEVPSSAFPSPSRVLLELWRGAPILWNNARVTAAASAEGLLAALAAGLVLAWFTTVPFKRRRVMPSQTVAIPGAELLTLVLLIVVGFGFGFSAAAVVSCLVCFLPMFVHLRAGFQSVPSDVIDVVQTMGAGPLRIFLNVRLPACLPRLMNAIRISIPLALSGAAVEEFVGSDSGLGYFIRYAGAHTEATQQLAALTFLVLMALGGSLVILSVERIWISWPPDALFLNDYGPSANCERPSSNHEFEN